MRKPTSFEFGVAASVLWIAFGVYLAFFSKVAHPTALDGWANVLAGFFSPVAFLWLVLGYRQQGEELQLNTQALKLQAEELKQAVEQYQDMANTQREQLEHERQMAAKEEQERKDARRPKFDLSHRNTFSSGGEGVHVSCGVANLRGEVTDIVFSPLIGGVETIPPRIARLATGDSAPVTFALQSLHPFALRINYQKVDGPGEEVIQIRWEGNEFISETIQAAT